MRPPGPRFGLRQSALGRGHVVSTALHNGIPMGEAQLVVSWWYYSCNLFIGIIIT